MSVVLECIQTQDQKGSEEICFTTGQSGLKKRQGTRYPVFLISPYNHAITTKWIGNHWKGITLCQKGKKHLPGKL